MKPIQLNIEHRELAPGAVVVALSGRLMLGPEGMELERVVGDLLGEGYRNFVLDMSGVSHIDSTGIGRCISSLNKIMQMGGKLHMVAGPGQVREGFRVTRLDRVFRFFEDIPAAQAAFP